MNSLPYYCHICDRIIYIGERIECPFCRSGFIEIHRIETEEEPMRKSLFHRLFPWANKVQNRSISADRRNYAIGAELDDIVTRLTQEKEIKENPATEDQLKRIKDTKITSEEICMICQCDITTEDSVHCYPCLHYFHSPCSEAWLRMQSECPICRQKL
ncbi:E3 ubiquitin-protein ligase RNF115/126 [Nematocida sp. AWRm80]|nr:E3 ubiquitin-protein ligase RNF115/126 [Nematocida sp. AWRm80]